MSQDFVTVLLQEVQLVLEPLTTAVDSPDALWLLFTEIGWDLKRVTGFDIARAQDIVRQFLQLYEKLQVYIEQPPDTLAEVKQALTLLKEMFTRLRELPSLVSQPQLPAGLDQLPVDLVDYLVVTYLERHRPVAWQAAVLLTLAVPATSNTTETAVVDSASGLPQRYPYPRSRLQLAQLAALLRDPVAVLQQGYPGDSEAIAARLFPRLADLLQACGVNALYGFNPERGVDFGTQGNLLAQQMLTFAIAPDLRAETSTTLGATIALAPEAYGDLGLVVAPFGAVQYRDRFGNWQFEVDLETAIAAFAIGTEGLTLPENVEAVLRPSAKLLRLAETSGPALLIGSAQGTRLELGHLQITADADLKPNHQEFGFLLEVGQAALVIAAGDGDGFLQKILPADGLRLEFDLALGWSNQKGVYFRGGGGLEAQLPVQASLFGLLQVESLYVGLIAKETGIQLAVAATATVKLGPVSAVVERVGLAANLAFPATGASLGPADLGLEFRPPDGAGLAIDAGIVVGGGYLFFDAAKEQYAGVVQLELGGTLALKAIGLLTTRMPDGSKGFSLLLIIAAEGFPPIQLGFGFTLTGIGGLLGVNRTAVVEALRAGIKTGTLNSILFPNDPIRNAPQIISTLNTVFPPAEDRFLFGPMAKIGWGTPTLLTIELGLVLELPSPVRLLILGRLKACLPDADHALVQVQMDALGVIDFDKGEISLDATLYDSRIAQFTLTGDMALRANWGENPNLLLAIGGFNPRFQPPANFPKLDRLALALATGNNPRLRLEAYLALTSNTLQFGARVEIYVAASKLSLEGYLGFDALFQFSPFHFIVDISGGLAVKYKGRSLMSVYLDAMLSGPGPWYVRGKARIEVLFFKVSVSFEKRFGPKAPPALPETTEVEFLLRSALSDSRNWSSQLPTRTAPLVTFRDVGNEAGMLLHPLGQLTVRQRIVPLAFDIDKFGNTTPTGDRRFEITAVQLNQAPSASVPIADYFAPAQFREMSDDQKLTQPSFTQEQAGVIIGSDRLDYGTPLTMAIEYEETQVFSPDVDTRQTLAETYQMSVAALESQVAVGTVSLSALRNSGVERYRVPDLA